jgi:hypothetical protein
MNRMKFDTSHLDRYRASGLTQAAYCQAHGVKPATLAYWLSKRKNESLAFVEVSGVTKQRPVDSFFSLSFGADGFRIKLHLDLTL